MLHRMHGRTMVRASSQPVPGETVIEPPPAPQRPGRPPRPGALPPPHPKSQQEGPLMAIPIALILYVLLLAGLGGRLWYARGRVSAAQVHLIARTTLRHGTVDTATTAVALVLLLLAR